MKFSSKERKVTSSQKTMAIELGLADQKKAIELLYSQYSNPIQTCVQELVSNAFDAMQDAGRSHVPIKVALPNELNDFYFSVRDFGNSMDDDAIKNVYMRVNASTKSNNNKAIGGFGIGSKTPWAYTDTFILKTFLNGLETQYALVKGRSSVSIVYQGETTQENGTEVVFKVKSRDKQYFEESVRRISLCAKTKPIVNTKVSLNFDSEDILSEVISIVKSDILEEGHTFINLGGVLYELDEDFLHNSNKPWRVKNNLSNLEGYLNHSTLIINLPVGSVMPLQTREGLFSQGEEGQQNKAVLKKVINYTLKVIESTIDARRKMVISPSLAVDFFANGMLSIRDRFIFGNIEVSSSGFNFKGSNSVSELSRKKSRGWGKAVRAKKTEHKFLTFKELNSLPIFFSELSPNKSRLVNRFTKICSTSDVIVLEKHLFNDTSVYTFLKEYTNARCITDIEIEKGVSSTKGTTRDNNIVVCYDYNGDRIGTIDLKKEHATKVVIGKDDVLKHGVGAYKLLGYSVIAVANCNLKRVLEHKSFISQEDAIDLEKLARMWANVRASRIISKKLSRSNLDYIGKLTNTNKQRLFVEPKYIDSSNFKYDLIDTLEKTYGKTIDRTVMLMLKTRARAVAIADKAPLAQHISSPKWLKGQAKRDLDIYILTNIGG